MAKNLSPWLAQVQDRPAYALEGDLQTDVAVVGAGIAGIATAYYLLRNTRFSVTLVEANRIARKATGHNAGHLVAYFERPFAEIVEEHGLKAAAHAQHALESAWHLLEGIIHDGRLTTPLYRMMGYNGCATPEQLVLWLRTARCRVQAGLHAEPLLVADDPSVLREIPAEYEDLFVRVPRRSILELLETEDTSYIAALAGPNGTMNGALFCEEVAAMLLRRFPGRFRVGEYLPVRTVTLEADHAILACDDRSIRAGKVVLCTNGFEKFDIENRAGPEINTSFHALVEGWIGYMSAYLELPGRPPVTHCYYQESSTKSDMYHYLLRRPFQLQDRRLANLLCVGDVLKLLPEGEVYDRYREVPDSAREEMRAFARSTFRHCPEQIREDFVWHGLMCYTPDRIRRIGFEPRNRTLLYNLGCNGIGMLPSVYGGSRIAELLSRSRVQKTIFDPRDPEDSSPPPRRPPAA